MAIVSSRVYNTTLTGTLGQYMPGIPFSNFVGKAADGGRSPVLSLQQLAQSPAYRTNLGLVEGNGERETVRIRVLDSKGMKLAEEDVELQPGEHQQLDGYLAKKSLSIEDGRIEIEVVSATGRVMAYASVVDNLTNDPILVRGVDPAGLNANKYVIPGVAHFDTVARWRSDIRLFNGSSTPVRATLAFHRQNESSAAKTATIMIDPGEVKALNNVLATTFSETNTGGAIHITTDSPTALVVTARTYDQTANGTIGQFIRGVTPADAVGVADRPLHILQLEDSQRFRTNVGVVEVTGNPARVQISAVVPDSKVESRLVFDLQPNEFRQYVSLLKLLNLGTVYNGRITIRVIDGSGRVAAYGSVIDNRTQDPTYVESQ